MLFFIKKLLDRVWTEVSALAFLAVFPYPNLIKLVHGLLNQFWIVGKDASLEVSSAVAFHADATAWSLTKETSESV